MAKKKLNKQTTDSHSLETPISVIPEYEKLRMLRIRENVEKMQSLGLEKRARSLMNCVENKGEKNGKGKRKKAFEEDEEYSPDVDAVRVEGLIVSDEDLNLEDEKKLSGGRSTAPHKKVVAHCFSYIYVIIHVCILIDESCILYLSAICAS